MSKKIINKEDETLFINTWSSTCGKCKHGADPKEKSHQTILSYRLNIRQKGCGQKWIYVSSNYPESVISNKQLKDMRPDLIIDREII